MKVIEKPYDLGQLRDLSCGGTRRVCGVVAIAWHDLPGLGHEALEEYLSRLVTGSRYGLDSITIHLAGCVGQSLLVEVSGCVAMFIEDHDLIVAEEAREDADARVA